MALLATGVAALAGLAVVAGRTNAEARNASVVQQAAKEKLEQLRALAWTSDAALVPVSDWDSNVAMSPTQPGGGVGLGVSPESSLASTVAGFADFIDANGRWLASGTRVPRDAAWVRRWSVQVFTLLPDTLVLQVLVVPVHTRDGAATVAAARAVNGAWLIDMRTRRAR